MYDPGVLAKLIVHRTGDSQVHSGHHSDLVCDLAIDEGTLIKLNNMRETQRLVFGSSETMWNFCGLHITSYHVTLK